MASEVTLLSAGAMEPGMAKVIAAFRRESGHDVKATFATAPAIRKRIVGDEKMDVIVAPRDVLDDLVKAGKTAEGGYVTVGRIGVGVTVRDGAPLPKIATVDEFKRSLLNAESVVYNQASTGIYLENLFARLGITEQLKSKTTRYPDAAPVLQHISQGKPGEIGLGAITVIIEGQNMGLKLVGPLPAEIQNFTTYYATVVAASVAEGAAREFVRYLTGREAKAAFAAAGIE